MQQKELHFDGRASETQSCPSNSSAIGRAAPELARPPGASSGTYPNHPGWKRHGTSQDAAESAAPCAKTLRASALRVLKLEDLTADEVAAKLDEDVLSIRPRISELAVQGKIIETGQRRKNRSGKSAMVWRAWL